MNKLSRRDFLKYSGIGALGLSAAIALAGCAKGEKTPGDSNEAGGETSTKPASNQNLTEVQQQAKDIDTSRPTTATTDKKYPCLSIPLNSDPGDLDIRCWWKKGDIATAVFEALGDENGDTFIPDQVMIKEYKESEPRWVTFEIEKNASGEDTKWVSGVKEVPEGTEGAVEAIYWDAELFDYIHDSDGNEIAAEDVVFSFREVLNSGYALKFNAFLWAEVVSKYVVRIWWKKADYEGVGSLEFPISKTAMFSKKGYEEGDYVANPIGTGPYKITNYVSGSEIVLDINENYWQKDESLLTPNHHANVQTVRFPVISETAQVIIALETGEANFTTRVPTDDLPTFSEGGEYGELYNIFRSNSGHFNGVLFNCYEGHITANKDFREGCCYALDSELIAQGAGSSYYPCKGPGSEGVPDYDTSLDDEINCQTVYDEEKAKELIKKSGYNGEELIYMYGDGEAHAGLSAQVIQILLERVGVKIKLNGVERNVSNADTPNPDKWDMMSMNAGGTGLIGGMNRSFGRTDFDTKQYIGYDDCIGFQNDEEMFRLFKEATDAKNFGPAATGAFLRHCIDNAYYKICYGEIQNLVYTADIAELAMRWSTSPSPWGSTFYVDDKINDISK